MKGKWQAARGGYRLVNALGRIVGRVFERPYPYWGEFSAEADGVPLGLFSNEIAAKTAVEMALQDTGVPAAQEGTK